MILVVHEGIKRAPNFEKGYFRTLKRKKNS